jgi:LacI family transcriptional regulator
MKDVAGMAGVSVMTVSRALSNHPRLAPPTRERILQTAEQLGYRPNPMVSALMRSRRTGRSLPRQWVLGFVTGFNTRNGWRASRLHIEFYEGAVEEADRRGYHIEEFWLREPRMTPQRLSQILHTRNIPGLLIAPLPVPLGHLRLDWDKFSAVALGHSLAWPPLHRAVDQQFHSVRLALHESRRHGYRRPGLAIRASLDQSAHHHWAGAFLVDQKSRKPPRQVPLFMVPDRAWGEARFKTWFQRSHPDVILSPHEEVLEWVKRLGLLVPQDVGFVHLSCPDTSGRFAGIYHQGRAVGAAAVDLLVDMIHRNERGIPRTPRWVLVEGTWQNGATLNGR